MVDNTELTTIICGGTEEKKREIFKRINTLGVPLSKFEVLNGLYHGDYIEGLNDYFAQDANVRRVLPYASVDRGDNKYHLLEYIYYVRNDNVFPKRSELDDYIQRLLLTTRGNCCQSISLTPLNCFVRLAIAEWGIEKKQAVTAPGWVRGPWPFFFLVTLYL